MRTDQTVSEMTEAILLRQAKVLVDQTGQSFESAIQAVAQTVAGGQLRELGGGPHRHTEAREWQEKVLARDRAEEHSRHLVDTDTRGDSGASPAVGSRYSWVVGYLERLHGKERREEYYARLGQERPSSGKE
jgi:hypothetical protein